MSDDGSSRILRVGVVGHRNNRIRPEDAAPLGARVKEVLDRLALIAGGQGANGLSVTSALAEGADRMGARAALASGYRLECPLPFERSEYEKDFSTEASRHEFRALLDAATSIWELRGTRAEGALAYENVGEAVIEHSDLLIAVWDGEEAHGRGGTADVVRAAAATRMPVVWIHLDPHVEIRLIECADGRDLVVAPASRLESAVAALL